MHHILFVHGHEPLLCSTKESGCLLLMEIIAVESNLVDFVSGAVPGANFQKVVEPRVLRSLLG